MASLMAIMCAFSGAFQVSMWRRCRLAGDRVPEVLQLHQHAEPVAAVAGVTIVICCQAWVVWSASNAIVGPGDQPAATRRGRRRRGRSGRPRSRADLLAGAGPARRRPSRPPSSGRPVGASASSRAVEATRRRRRTRPGGVRSTRTSDVALGVGPGRRRAAGQRGLVDACPGRAGGAPRGRADFDAHRGGERLVGASTRRGAVGQTRVTYPPMQRGPLAAAAELDRRLRRAPVPDAAAAMVGMHDESTLGDVKVVECRAGSSTRNGRPGGRRARRATGGPRVAWPRIARAGRQTARAVTAGSRVRPRPSPTWRSRWAAATSAGSSALSAGCDGDTDQRAGPAQPASTEFWRPTADHAHKWAGSHRDPAHLCVGREEPRADAIC